MNISSLSSIFSIPNEKLVSDGSVDPMGMQAIWTYFGQEIFEEKLTTVSNDIRNYTINLMHHLILFKLETSSDFFSKAQKKYKAYTDLYKAKSGILIFLEDLLTYSLIEQRDGVNTEGLLGNNNAEKKLISDKSDSIEIKAERMEGILVRQHQLGINGRYKGPFEKMGIMSKSGAYAPDVMEKAGVLFDNWSHAKNLMDQLLRVLNNLIESDSEDYPKKKLLDLNKGGLWVKYKDTFGNFNIPNEIKSFWIESLGLECEPAKTVFDLISISEEKINKPSFIFVKAYTKMDDDDAKNKISNIIHTEPLLSLANHVFYILSDSKVKKISEKKEDLKMIYDKLKNIHSRVPENKNNRLDFLLSFLKKVTDWKSLAIEVLNYHKAIMAQRGGSAWVEFESDEDILKHLIHQHTKKHTDDIIKDNEWYNEYYIGPLYSIKKGLFANG